MSDITLRSMTEDDIPAAVALVTDLREWFNKDVPEHVRADYARCLGLVAAAEENVVGFVLWQQEADLGEIKWLAVARELHRRRVGSLLLDGLIRLAREAGIRQISVDTLAPTHDYEPYARSRAFYEALGFRPTAIERGGFPEGSDRVTYVLALQPR